METSGSMGGQLTARDPTKSRISLTKEAIKMFLSKLRDDDSFGLVQFTDISKTLIQCDLKKNLELKKKH